MSSKMMKRHNEWNPPIVQKGGLVEHVLDVGRGVGIWQMLSGESQSIQQTIRGSSWEVFQCSDTTFDVNRWLAGEGTSRVKVIKENNRTSHASKAEHIGFFVLETRKVKKKKWILPFLSCISLQLWITYFPFCTISWQTFAIVASASVTFSRGTPSPCDKNLTVVSLMTFIIGVG